MRLFTIILSLYLLALTGFPCCVSDNCENEQAKTTTGTHRDRDKQDNKGGCGTCSPFSCHCCAGFIVPQMSHEVIVNGAIFRPSYSMYRIPYNPVYVPFSWQPPDIV